MSKPIPDEALVRLAGDTCRYGEHPLAGLARELLDARAALRSCAADLDDAASLCTGMANRESEYGWDDWMDWADEYRAGAEYAWRLLPDQPEAT